jgi:hypothetical protein
MSFTDIDSVADEKYIHLRTIGRKTKNPHLVELLFAVADGKIYLSHEGAYTDWMKNILKDDHVEFKIGDHSFKGKARIFPDGAAFEIGKNALYFKYYGKANKDVIDDWFSESTVIEIICS